MRPTIGRIVLYTLSEDDAKQINRRRTTAASIAQRMPESVVGHHADDAPEGLRAWPAGAQAHIGNGVAEGDVFPMLIVRTWGDTPESSVNGQVFLDGSDVYWATSVAVGEGPRTWAWPARV